MFLETLIGNKHWGKGGWKIIEKKKKKKKKQAEERLFGIREDLTYLNILCSISWYKQNQI